MSVPGWLRRIRIDRFLLAIIASAVIASIVPARGAGVPVFSWLTTIVIGLLFFLYGARLEPREALEGLRHWRLHGLILSFTFLVFPLIGVALHPLLSHLISPDLYAGLLYVTMVPSTVQSSVNFTSIARGNVAGAIVSASFSNLIGVFITPLLALLLLSTAGGLHIQGSAILDIVLQLLVPFILGQLSRPLTARFVVEHRKPLKLVDQGSIVLVVYSAFSAGMREHIWSSISIGSLAIVLLVILAMLAFMLWLTWTVAGRLGFNRADRIAIQFCGTKKSLATGLPMASVLFAGSPVGLIVLPLMVFHQSQLMACGSIAARYAREAEDAERSRRQASAEAEAHWG
ncbi:MAG TPA: bile acid:sodium symporter family protein [Propionibacteriaceae bacterium]|nr:bile acid:sodium symporter family protein [Propionibacteriaceae bacterium]